MQRLLAGEPPEHAAGGDERPGEGNRVHTSGTFIVRVTRRAGSDRERRRPRLAPLPHCPGRALAIGLERWVSRLTGAANVRETTFQKYLVEGCSGWVSWYEYFVGGVSVSVALTGD